MKRMYLFLLIAIMAMPMMGQQIMEAHYKKVLVVGAHPDDPESMAGGTILMLKAQGCEVVVVYFTQGERGIEGNGIEETRTIRHKEALDACEKMGVRAIFMSQVDGESYVNQQAYSEMLDIMLSEKPEMVITHWPIDSHRDHRNCSVITYDAWRRSGYAFDLYYGEVMTGLQTQNFQPDTWVDITPVRELKLEAYLQHKSQMNDGNIQAYHDPMELMRGLEFRCKYAEGYVKQHRGR